MTTVGGYIEHARLGRCRIIAEHGTGTYDVEASDGRCYRITGVRMVPMKRTRCAPTCAGWDLSADSETGIVRCDTCGRFGDDQEACEHVAGLLRGAARNSAEAERLLVHARTVLLSLVKAWNARERGGSVTAALTVLQKSAEAAAAILGKGGRR